jgi:hypothetical protein
MPFPLAALAICRAAHSKKPISSKMSEIIMIAINENVAFHTIRVTSRTSPKCTTPTSKARMAPPQADQPMDKFLGCHITNTSVMIKINAAKNVETNIKSPYYSHVILKP